MNTRRKKRENKRDSAINKRGSDSAIHKRGGDSAIHKRGGDSAINKRRSAKKRGTNEFAKWKKHIQRTVPAATPEKIVEKYISSRKVREKKIKEIERKIDSPTPIKNLNCSPIRKKNDFTCYEEDELIKIKNMWNERNPKNKITETKKKDIWIALMDKMKNSCDNEMCWLKQKFVDHNISSKILKESFAPLSPSSWEKNPNEWLSNFDLKAVMKQYEKKYEDFYFIGPSPIDFDKVENRHCVLDDLCMFNLKSYVNKGKKKIGIIFNTDPHDKGGSHWISLFINLPEKYIYFFNSTGEEIPPQIQKLVDRIILQGKSMDIVLKFSQNAPKSHQRGGSECGMYSLYFIINVLNGTVKPEFFNTETITDKNVEIFRKILFNSSKSV
jgi:hypothetical protein